MRGFAVFALLVCVCACSPLETTQAGALTTPGPGDQQTVHPTVDTNSAEVKVTQLIGQSTTSTCGGYQCPRGFIMSNANNPCGFACSTDRCCRSTVPSRLGCLPLLAHCRPVLFQYSDYRAPVDNMPDMPDHEFAYSFSLSSSADAFVGIYSRDDQLQFEIVFGLTRSAIRRSGSEVASGAAIPKLNEHPRHVTVTYNGEYLRVFVSQTNDVLMQYSYVGAAAHRIKIKGSSSVFGHVCQLSWPSISYFSTNLAPADQKVSTIDTRARNHGLWATQGYCEVQVDSVATQHRNEQLCVGGATINVGQRFRITFTEPSIGTWLFLLPGIGSGCAVTFDSLSVPVTMNSDGIETISVSRIGRGVHTLVVYGAGNNLPWLFQRNQETPRELSVSQLAAVAWELSKSELVNILHVVQACSTSTLNTGDDGRDTLMPGGDFVRAPNDGFAYQFQVRAKLDAHISVWSATNSFQFEIGLGGWNNEKSVTMMAKNGSDNKNIVETPSILSETEFRNFFVTYDGARIYAGIGSSGDKLATFADAPNLQANFPKFLTGWGGTGTWQNVCQLTRAIDIRYFSVPLNNQGSLVGNTKYIENKYLANDNIKSGYCWATLDSLNKHTNRDLCISGSNSNAMQRFEITFVESNAPASWELTIYLDAWFGYAVYFDGAIIAEANFSAHTSPVTVRVSPDTIGVHRFLIYSISTLDRHGGSWTFDRNGVSRPLNVKELQAAVV